MKMFSITGWSGSGKTTLLTRIIARLREMEKRVVSVKHAPHKYNLQPESKDTYKFLDAGSEEVCLVAKNEIVTMKQRHENDDILATLEARYQNCDYLLLEGLKGPGIPIVEVYDSSLGEPLKNPVQSLAAVVSNCRVTDVVPNFAIDDIDNIIDFMEAFDGQKGYPESQ
ncbi:MAG: molybdopterin-guanine dinucleotide biosynthesis protein B [bacterium]|nr:molybdopterin-guanine dinucleotide biosynthesis protein B [bacterium]